MMNCVRTLQCVREYVQIGYLTLLIVNASEVYSARERNGIYIPRERYFEEEAEKKVDTPSRFLGRRSLFK